MPNNDQTGPQGKGPQTGRGLGKCNSNSDKGHGGHGGRGVRTGRNFNQDSQNN